jgi:putative NIF3 family GTP cyclohydrolase 1 type 2
MKYQMLLLSCCCLIFFGLSQNLHGQNLPTAKTVIEEIISQTECARLVDYLATGLEAGTNDIIKEGNPETRVTGIVTTMFATMEVLRAAVKKGGNLIITHEPLYYNHFDYKEPFKKDEVFLQKQKFIKENNLVVWRFHDYIHCLEPDGVLAGMVEQLKWQEYVVNTAMNQFQFEDKTLADILKHLKDVFPDNAFYVIGDPKMSVKNVELAPGSPGAERHFSILRKSDVDLLIAGEVPQWETYEYVRDAQLLGMKKAIVFLGHVNSEEAGMKYAADWMKGFLKEIPIHFIESKAPYWSY